MSSCRLGSEFEAPQDVVTIANASKTALVFNIIGSFILISYVDLAISEEPKRLYVGNAPIRLGSFIGNTPKVPLG
jgi:dihydroxyacetone kinase DhaKLM complex PTS-EIIA-like component DhaM